MCMGDCGIHNVDMLVRWPNYNVTVSTQKTPPTPTPMVSFSSLFRFARPQDILFLIIGSIASAFVGAGLPFSFFIFGGMINSFVDNGKLGNILKVSFNSDQLFRRQRETWQHPQGELQL